MAHQGAATITQSSSQVKRDFYNSITALALIQHGHYENPTNNETKPWPYTRLTDPWHRYLDELCHLCQNHKAEAVVPIAVEGSAGSATFWTALTKGNPDSLVSHLSWLLMTLRDAHVQGQLETRPTMTAVCEEIARRSIERSGKRVGNYWRILRNLVNSVRVDLRKEVPDEGRPESMRTM